MTVQLITDAHGGLPCLPVDDVEAATAFYRRYFGFEVVGTAPDAATAAVRRDNTTIVLRRRDPSEPTRIPGDQEFHTWSAIVPLIDFEGGLEELSVRGVQMRSPVLPHPLLGRTFTIEDRFGNLLCFCPARVSTAQAAREWVRESRRRLESARFTRAALADLRPHLDEFRSFYDRLEQKRDIYYMFFTGGLLHWAVKAESYVPPDVNLVLIGSDLSTAEREWIAAHIKRPFHHMNVLVNDWPVWDFLLETNQFSFGWLDIDCLVLNPEILREATKLPARAAVNCVWSYDSGYDCRIANTYLMFVNIDAIRELRARRIPVWARPHDWRGGDRSEQAGMRCFYRVPSARERRVMRTVAPTDEHGRPRPPGSRNFFDTMSVFQILAHAIGFDAHHVRRLENPMLGPIEPGQAHEQPQEMSDEIVHVGGISYYHEHFHNPAVRIRYLAADYVTLRALAPRLPASYSDRLAAVAEELRSLGADPEQVEQELREYLHSVGGLSMSAIDQALQVASPVS